MSTIPNDPPGKFRATRTLVYEGEHQWLREALARRGVKGTHIVGPRGQIREEFLSDIEPIEAASHEEWVEALTKMLRDAPITAMDEVLENFGTSEPGDDA